MLLTHGYNKNQELMEYVQKFSSFVSQQRLALRSKGQCVFRRNESWLDKEKNVIRLEKSDARMVR